jgi:phage terminase small subunit
MKLNEKHKRFANEYLKDLNGTQAAIRAGYSPKTARVQGSKLLTNANIQEYLVEINSKRMEVVKIDANYVLQRHYEIDQLDVIDILDDELNLKPLNEWPKVWRTALSSIDIMRVRDFEAGKDDSSKMESVIQKIKWPDKLRNLELLGKHVEVNAYRESTAVDPSLQKETITRVFHVVE